jgi:ABC-type transport system involved in multi-copper enzyme maturation permease subunit
MTALIGIYRRELGRLFAGSGISVCLPLGLAWLAWQRYYGGLDVGALDPLDETLRLMGVVLVILAVWLTAPALSAERQHATATLWAISPVRPGAVLIGKFAALSTVLTLAVALLFVGTLGQGELLAQASPMRLLTGLLGLLLLVLSATSMTLLASALVSHFSTAFAWGLSLLCGWVWGPEVLARGLGTIGDLVPALGVLERLLIVLSAWDAQAVVLPLFLGWLDLGMVAVVLAGSILLLLITQQVIGSERWRD